jgi:hypothetical protein
MALWQSNTTVSSQQAILLSGTPALNRAVELYNQLASLVPKNFASYTAFCERFEKKINHQNNPKI